MSAKIVTTNPIVLIVLFLLLLNTIAIINNSNMTIYFSTYMYSPN